ncbi:MAG: hypothetical protein J6V58_04690 [Clostridia bacterium]|nr:hypothetical protein [Clostridia bacterium]
MKKLIAILIAVLIVNLCAFADTFDFSDIEDKVDVPDNYTVFTSWHDIAEDVNYILSWSGDDSDGGVLTVVADSQMRIKSYSKYEYGKYMGNNKLSSIDYNGAVTIATEFVKKLAPEFYDKLVIVKQNNFIARNNENYDILFYRYENNIPCYSDYVTVSVDAYTKEPVEYSAHWTDCERISPSYRTMAESKASQLYFENIGVLLTESPAGLLYSIDKDKYINAYTGKVISFNETGYSTEGEAVLTSEDAFGLMLKNCNFTLQYIPLISNDRMEFRAVYGFDPTYPVNIDATTGQLCTDNGQPYRIAPSKKYKDIDRSSSKKQIETLLLAGITPFTEENFNADSFVTKTEFAQMIYLAFGKIATVYGDDFITHEQAIEQLVNALGYGEIAYLPDTYRVDFVDGEHISKDLVGCVSIAQGLEIIRGNAFMPKSNSTRAYCTEIIYNAIAERTENK